MFIRKSNSLFISPFTPMQHKFQQNQMKQKQRQFDKYIPFFSMAGACVFEAVNPEVHLTSR